MLSYDYVIKSQVLVGAVNMGALRAMNLLAASLLISASPDRQDLILAGSGYAIYIVSVTLLGILEDEDRVQRRVVLGLLAAPSLSASLVIYAVSDGWFAPGVAFGLAGCLLIRHQKTEWDQRSIRGAMTWLLLGTMAYTALLALASGSPVSAAIIAAFILPARWISRWISLT